MPAVTRDPRYRCALVGLLLMQLVTGCIVGPNYCRPDTPVPDQWHQQLEDGQFAGSESTYCWWTLFQDPVLNELIACTRDGNLDLYAAFNRILQARTQVCIARSARLVQAQSTQSFTNQRQSANAFGIVGGGGGFFLGQRDLWATSIDLSWEPDLFGRVQRQIESACATDQATVEAYRDLMVILYGQVAATYVRIRTTQAQLDYARQNVMTQRRALELAKKRVEGGVSAILDQHQAESNLASTEAEIPPLEFQLHQDLNRLAVLIGEYPGSLHECLAIPQPIPVPPDPVAVGVPCDMIRQRPDIRQAERTIAARSADLGVAAAEIFPRFTINGSLGLQSQNLSSIFDGNSMTYNVGPGVTWPILQGGRILCNIDRADAALQESIAIYEQTILQATEEVENAIVGYKKERQRREALLRTVEAAQDTLESVLETYRAGKTDFQNVLDSLRSLFVAQNALAISEGQVVQQLILLYRALGGGWDPTHHCGSKCVRLQCPSRVGPSYVETNASGDPSQRYFGQADDSDDDAEDEEDQKDRDDADELDATSDDLDDGSDAKNQEDSLFKKKLEELKKRLEEPPSESVKEVRRISPQQFWD